jgi:hypothetical protein
MHSELRLVKILNAAAVKYSMRLIVNFCNCDATNLKRITARQTLFFARSQEEVWFVVDF